MMPLTHANRRFMQLCWVVPDLHAAMAAWTRAAGVGPFFLFETVPFEDARYRGRPADAIDIIAAIAQAGDMQIELVCQKDDHPSLWRDIVPFGQSGLHHMALYCSDYDADLAAYTGAGAQVAFSCKMMGSRTCWVDTSPMLGSMVELIEANGVADAVFGQIRAAAQNWDGKQPVRTLG